ncbi:DEAD/DEAH box helicase [Corynebacterium propinquum]|uniref:DEAD/DEAH box helicase n=1 Tax=Corynebacterium propinquum TaxID=43769 RepID=UPI000F874553|nr:DEAD/DEAH box helicase [Corynebacterium propinquum]RUP80506.1 DEAD/DEAH box helicase [Corynebacterium propinquum]RUP90729.1 DEAD/DEAH box helicase [Corynebacterium propinquum]RUP96889.1 DEAD/DEAH box helicase [Corynebacterium propinquum]
MMSTHFETFRSQLDYELDPFQIQGCVAVENGQGVLVCAPTGAGKTVVGEFAVSLALSRGTKCFYTTPIKALSNQKFHDLIDVHGPDAVGLLTGDVSIRPDAEIVVMTTEVLRNMIYAKSPALDRLTHVVMDEIHFLADQARGAVWEEVILNLEEHISIIGLSATVSNSEEFGRWLSAVRGDTEVIVSDTRPVPLEQWMLLGQKVYPLFAPGTDIAGDDVAERATKVNPELQRRVARLEAGDADDGRADFQAAQGFRSRSVKGTSSSRSGVVRPQDKYRPLGRPEVLRILQGQNMLPAIIFIFSRAGCDGALHQCLRSKMVLTDDDEQHTIAEIIDAGVEGIPQEDLEILRFSQWRKALIRGFAAHHAGMLPAFRHIVEELFVRGLVRAVFATETLALGINMPARSVVLEKLVKFNGEAHVDLTPGQYTQLTGRAGRRGIDTIGNAIVQWAPAMDPQRVAGLASTRTYPLISTFEPGYNMAINLLNNLGMDDALRLLEKSFAQYQADGSVVEETRDIERAVHRVDKLREQLNDAIAAFAPPSTDDEDPAQLLSEYVELRKRLSVEEKSAKTRAKEERNDETRAILAKLQIGDVIALPSKKRPVLAVVNTPANQTADPRPWITTEKGWSARIDSSGFENPPAIIGRMKLPPKAVKNPRRHNHVVVDKFAKEKYPRPKKMKLRARVRDTQRITKIRTAMKEHPAHAWPALEREQLTQLAQKYVRRKGELARLQDTVDKATETLGDMLRRIVDLLTELDYVDVIDGEPTVSAEGEKLAQVHNASDLLVAQCLKRGIWQNLDPAELAGVVSMCTFENRRATGGQVFEGVTDEMTTAMEHTMRLWEELIADEARHGLPNTREPEPGFSIAIHQWCAGAPLGYCLAAAAESGAELTPGDFVRWCRQVIDLLQQVAKTGYSGDIKRMAGQAIGAINRGVVAIGS